MPSLLLEIRRAFEAEADPKKAPVMQAYMKSTMPYYGIQTPLRKALCKPIFARTELPSAGVWQGHVLDLWRNARFREERYAALGLAADRRAKPFHDPRVMKMYEEMIVTGAWWDFVDDLAHRVGFILSKHPKPMSQLLLRWSRSENLWKRRTSIISQLGFKRDTDLELLYACIEPSISSKEFFLQKGIGWALREYAWTDPKEVIRYVRKNESRLSPLSKREALKNCGS
jgi:3-methyladenine DNA glycosylase AlkD